MSRVATFRCSSPTCRSVVTVQGETIEDISADLTRLGWKFEKQAGDDAPMPYCSRDKDGE